jgi:AcrR family transcriptional regulator
MAERAARSPRAYRGRSAGERIAERRGRLLAAAIELLGREGGEGLSVRAVCAAANLGPRYFYESFESLEALEQAAFDAVVEGAAQAVGAALAGLEPDPARRARATIEAFVGYVVDDAGRARILLVEGLTNQALHERRLAAVRMFAELAATQARELYGSPPGSERLVEHTARLIVGGFAELLVAYTRGELAADREELIDDAADLLEATARAAARLAADRQSRRE